MAIHKIATRVMRKSDSTIRRPYGDLAQAVIERAIKDALGKDLRACSSSERAHIADSARVWLLSPDGLAFAELAGCNVNLIRRWAAAGCPTSPQPNPPG